MINPSWNFNDIRVIILPDTCIDRKYNHITLPQHIGYTQLKKIVINFHALEN